MQTRSFSYQVRHVRKGEARLVAYYDADADLRPAAIVLPAVLGEGAVIDVQFITNPANHAEIMDDDND